MLSINNMLPVPFGYSGIHSHPSRNGKMVQIYQSFVICKLWVHLVAEAVILGAKEDVNSEDIFQDLISSAWVVVCKKIIIKMSKTEHHNLQSSSN